MNYPWSNLAAAQIQQLALGRMKASVVGFGDVLEEKSCRKHDEQEYAQCQNNSVGTMNGREPIESQSFR